MFKSHLISLLVFAVIVSVLLALIKFNRKEQIIRYALKIFLYMLVGVVVFSWFMRFL